MRRKGGCSRIRSSCRSLAKTSCSRRSRDRAHVHSHEFVWAGAPEICREAELDVRGSAGPGVLDLDALVLAPGMRSIAVTPGIDLKPELLIGGYVGDLVDERILPPPAIRVQVCDVKDPAIDPGPDVRVCNARQDTNQESGRISARHRRPGL